MTSPINEIFLVAVFGLWYRSFCWRANSISR